MKKKFETIKLIKVRTSGGVKILSIPREIERELNLKDGQYVIATVLNGAINYKPVKESEEK